MGKLSKIAAIGMAAAMATSLSSVAFAENSEQTWTDKNGNVWEHLFEVKDSSGYEITIERRMVDGKEMAAICLSGLPTTMLTREYDYRIEHDDGSYEYEKFRGIEITVDRADISKFLLFSTQAVDEDFRCNDSSLFNVASDYFSYMYSYFSGIDQAILLRNEYPQYYEEHQLQKVDNGDTFTLEAYFEIDSEIIAEFAALDETTIFVAADIELGHGLGASGGATDYRMSFASDGTADKQSCYKERVKITNNLDFSTLTDEATGVTVSGRLPDGASLKVEALTAEDGKAAYDIKLVGNDGSEVEPNGKVTVTLPVPEQLKGAAELYVYSKSNDNYTLVEKAAPKDGSITFTDDRLSEYVITAEEIKADADNESTSDDESTSTDESASGDESIPGDESTPTDDNNSKPNADTGAAGVAAVTGVAILAAGAIVVSMKKK